MTLTIAHIATSATSSSVGSFWGVLLTSSAGNRHALRLPHEQGDPAPTWQDVKSHLATLPEGHDLHRARLVRMLTQRQYLLLITDDELLDIQDAANGRGDFTREQRKVCRRAVQMTTSADKVDLASPLAEQLVKGLAAAGMLAHEGRTDEILSGTRPEDP